MVDDAVPRHEVASDHRFEFFRVVRAMDASRDEDRNFFAWDAGLFKCFQYWREDHFVRHGSGYIGDHDTCGRAPFRTLSQGR